ncbi:MAG TPA: hypothetical protein VFB78_07590 [Acidimicrobiales bacterium]|nr:hypothetical protein [Acidimicrobiales bacterium]
MAGHGDGTLRDLLADVPLGELVAFAQALTRGGLVERVRRAIEAADDHLLAQSVVSLRDGNARTCFSKTIKTDNFIRAAEGVVRAAQAVRSAPSSSPTHDDVVAFFDALGWQPITSAAATDNDLLRYWRTMFGPVRYGRRSEVRFPLEESGMHVRFILRDVADGPPGLWPDADGEWFVAGRHVRDVMARVWAQLSERERERSLWWSIRDLGGPDLEGPSHHAAVDLAVTDHRRRWNWWTIARHGDSVTGSDQFAVSLRGKGNRCGDVARLLILGSQAEYADHAELGVGPDDARKVKYVKTSRRLRFKARRVRRGVFLTPVAVTVVLAMGAMSISVRGHARIPPVGPTAANFGGGERAPSEVRTDSPRVSTISDADDATGALQAVSICTDAETTSRTLGTPRQPTSVAAIAELAQQAANRGDHQSELELARQAFNAWTTSRAPLLSSLLIEGEAYSPNADLRTKAYGHANAAVHLYPGDATLLLQLASLTERADYKATLLQRAMEAPDRPDKAAVIELRWRAHMLSADEALDELDTVDPAESRGPRGRLLEAQLNLDLMRWGPAFEAASVASVTAANSDCKVDAARAELLKAEAKSGRGSGNDRVVAARDAQAALVQYKNACGHEACWHYGALLAANVLARAGTHDARNIIRTTANEYLTIDRDARHHVAWHKWLGDAYYDDGNPGPAIPEYAAAVRGDPSFVSTENRLAYLLAFVQQPPDFLSAIAHGQAAVDTARSLSLPEVDTYEDYVLYLHLRHGDADAQRNLEAFGEAHPALKPKVFGQISTYFDRVLNDQSSALAWAQKSAAAGPDMDAYLYLARDPLEFDRWCGALRAAFEDSAPAHFCEGRRLVHDDRAAALGEYDTAADKDPTWADPLAEKANALIFGLPHDYDGAVVAADAAVQREPTSVPGLANQALARARRSAELDPAKRDPIDLQAAALQARKALKFDDGYWPQRALAEVLAAQAQWAEAVEHWHAAAGKADDAAQRRAAVTSEAQAQYQAKDYSGAVATIRRFVDTADAAQSQDYYDLGDYLAAARDVDARTPDPPVDDREFAEVVDAYRRGVSLDKDPDPIYLELARDHGRLLSVARQRIADGRNDGYLARAAAFLSIVDGRYPDSGISFNDALTGLVADLRRWRQPRIGEEAVSRALFEYVRRLSDLSGVGRAGGRVLAAELYHADLAARDLCVMALNGHVTGDDFELCLAVARRLRGNPKDAVGIYTALIDAGRAALRR